MKNVERRLVVFAIKISELYLQELKKERLKLEQNNRNVTTNGCFFSINGVYNFCTYFVIIYLLKRKKKQIFAVLNMVK